MSKLTPALIDAMLDVHRQAQAAGHGGKGAVYDAACARFGITRATLMRRLADVTLREPRKQRSDAGEVSLNRDDAMLISGILMDSHRKTGKRLMSVQQAADIARANGHPIARIDADTGELLPLSTSAIARGLRSHALHPDQLNQPAPHTELQSLHPNHVWQIDASLCVLYYLHTHNSAEAGLQVMERDKFYKNKPANLKRIEADRVWSYEWICHYSGALGVHYVMGAESGENLAESFITAICKRERDPFHGVPFILMMDMGSANTSGLFKTLARRLQVQVIAHASGNARATGGVEKARDLIERSFESGLKMRPVSDLAALNEMAQKWAVWFNTHKVHSRHGQSRYAVWMGIKPDQLRIAPPAELCRELLTHTPQQRKVSGTLTVEFKGAEYDVRSIPGVMVGERLHVTYNPWAPEGSATIVDTDADGNERLHTVPLVARNDAGFRIDAPVIGEGYARPADTVADTQRKAVERFVMDAATDDEAAAKRKAKALPFGGRIDPFKVIEQAPDVNYLPRRGTDLPTTTITPRVAQAAPRLLTHFEAARALVALGLQLQPDHHALMRQQYPSGVPETEIESLHARLVKRAALKVVGGNAL